MNDSTNDKYDDKHHAHVDNETQSIKEMVKKNVEQISMDELKKAVSHINTGKSADHYGLTIENVLYAGDPAIEFLLRTVNIIFTTGEIPDGLKTGIKVEEITKKTIVELR